MNKPTIGIIGMGFVGNAIFQTINQSFKVLTYDINKYKCNSTLSSLSQKCKIIFICLPTPTDKKGECNTESIKDTISQINKFSKDNILILKSTVSIGTTQKLSEIFKNFTLVHNPEFLTEKNSVSDFKNTTRIILGGSKSATSIVSEFYCKLFPDATIVQTNSNGVIAVCGNASTNELNTNVIPFMLRGIKLYGMDSANCNINRRIRVF